MRRVAVVGGGLGGLVAAGLLARGGHEVVLYERSGALGGKAQGTRVGALAFDLGPTLLTLPHLVEGAFEALGARDLLPRFTPLEPQCDYRFADGCGFTAYADVERTAGSARELRPREAKGVRSFYAAAEAIWRAAGEPYLEAPYEGMPGFMARVARRGLSAVAAGARLGTLDELAREHFVTDHLHQFVGRFATYAGASPYQASAAFALIPHLERAYGVHHVQGGIGALAGALARAVRRLGVRVHLDARAHVGPEGTRWRVGPVGEAESYDAVVVNEDPLAHEGRAHQAGPLALSGAVLLAEVSGGRAPLAHHTVLFGRDYRREFDQLFAGALADDPTVYVCHAAATDDTMAPADQSGLFLMVNAPALPAGLRDAEAAREGWAGGGAAWARVEAQVLERLYAHAPELRGRVRLVGRRGPAELERLGAPGGSIYGFLPHGRFGPFRRPRNRGERPGLFYAGGGTHPGGGVPLVLQSGRFAALLAEQHLTGRRAP